MDSEDDRADRDVSDGVRDDAAVPGLRTGEEYSSETSNSRTAVSDAATAGARWSVVTADLEEAGLDRRAVLMRIAAQETVALIAVTELANERGRAARAAAAVTAAETAADEVVKTAATVRLRVAESAHRVALAAAEAAAFAAASVVRGGEASAARTAARAASAVTAEAMAVAEEAGVAAAVVAEAAGAAAVDMAAITADTDLAIELEESRALAEVRALVRETVRRIAAEACVDDELG